MTKKVKILRDIKSLLVEKYGKNISEVILFGSQINGKAKSYSDYDILVVLNNKYDWKIRNSIIDLSYDVDLKYNVYTNIKVFSKLETNTLKGIHPLYQDAIKNGLYA